MSAYAVKTAPTRSKTPARNTGNTELASGPKSRADNLSALIPGSIQFKLSLGQSGDRFETEADHMADRVSQGQKTGPVTPIPSGGLQTAQRMESEEEETLQAKSCEGQVPEEEKKEKQPIQRKETGEEDEDMLQAKAAPGKGPDLEEAAEALSQSGEGKPLSPIMQGKLEDSFGANLAAVRVHQDSAAQRATSALKARAFTRGKDIFMAQNESPEDTPLVAHETAHVLQQQAIPQQEQASEVASKDAAQQPSAEPEPKAPEPGATGADASTASAAPTAPAATPEAKAGEAKIETKDPKDKKGPKDKKDQKGKAKEEKKEGAGEDGADGGAAAAEKARAAREAVEKRNLKRTKKKAEKSSKQQQGPAASPASARKASSGAAWTRRRRAR